MENIPDELRQVLLNAGYNLRNTLPNNAESARWAGVKADCNLTNPQLNQIINALFPEPQPQGKTISNSYC